MSSKRKCKDASDPQKDRLYKWEHQWIDWNRKQIQLSDCKDFIAGACKLYEVDVPSVSAVGDNWEFSGYWTEENAIVLANSHQNIASALHEASHVIVGELAPRAQDHGPLFCGVYFFLLANGEWYPSEAIYASARKAGIRWSRKATPAELVL